jgi:hypothetical protein
MKPFSPSTALRADAPDSKAPRTSRRLVVGAGVAAGAALAVAALQRKGEPSAQVAATASDPAPAQGYRLTDHVRRYYETTRT